MNNLQANIKTPDEKYQYEYSRLEKLITERINQRRYPAMGYTTNLDLLCDFQVENLNRMLSEHFPHSSLSQMQKANKIDTIEDLLQTLVYFCANGIGGEVDIGDPKIVQKSFKCKYGIGGTAPQAAMALATVGCPSVIHMTDNSKELCELLDSPFIYTVSENEELVHTNCIKQTHEQEIHFIIQFKKGDKICLQDEIIEIPISNRVILTKITVNAIVPFSESYFKYIEKNSKTFSSTVLSSFNALFDEAILRQRLEYVIQHIKVYRQNNPDGVVFFEDAHYHDSGIRRLCLEKLYSQVDIVSLNEEELKYTLDTYKFSIDLTDIYSCIEGAHYIRKKLNVQKGIIIHTKDYSMYVGNTLSQNIEQGLIYGNLLATAKAINGWYGTNNQVEDVLKLPLSQKGIQAYEIIQQSQYADCVKLVPTKYIDKPQYTIGLGDTFVAGVQMCF